MIGTYTKEQFFDIVFPNIKEIISHNNSNNNINGIIRSKTDNQLYEINYLYSNNIITVKRKERVINMFDSNTSLPRLNTLHPSIKDEAIEIVEKIEKEKGVIIRITYAYRSFDEQQAIYNQGRTTPGKIVTNAKPGYSYHNYRLALDFCLLHKDKTISWDTLEDLDKDKVPDWLEVIDVFEDYGWESGYRWKQLYDAPHLQKTFGHTINDLYEKHINKQYDENGYIIL